MRTRSVVVALALLATLPLAPSPVAHADHSLPPLDPTKIEYAPIGYYGPPDEAGTPHGESAQVPLTPAGQPPTLNNPNPSGKWIAYDTNVWESLTLPYRHPGDNCNSLPAEERPATCLSGDRDDDTSDPAARTGYTGYQGPHGTSNVHGTCPPSPEIPGPWGQCFNNQLEYLDHYEHSMETSFADLGMIVKRYAFHSPGALGGSLPRGSYLAASGGQAYNISATIPGADHPEETVIVGAHYDFTDSGPAAAWDSAEGHTEIMRMAYIMADYYRKTGTRPSVTLKFIPWDSEESGTFGSLDYVNNNIPPGETDEVRGYFNVDPCAGAYPAFEEGTNRQVRQVLQVADPAAFEDEPAVKARIESWNAKAEVVIDQVLNILDDRLTRPGGAEVPIFVSDEEAKAGVDDRGPLGGAASDRSKIVTAVGGLQLFGSDYSNFEARGIPIFNFFPDYFGPHAHGDPSDGGGKGLQILHTNNDNLLRINRLTSGLISPGNLVDPTGTYASEGWAKGMEFCSQVEAWGMLQPEMAGAQTANTDPVAYYEALPNEAIADQLITFDATGSYQYANVASRTMEPEGALTYQWDFGDGTSATGKTVEHAYAEVGRYVSTLTVTGAGGKQDTMSIPIEVIGSNFVGPVLNVIEPADAEDGNFPLAWDFTGTRRGFERFGIEEAADFRSLFTDTAQDITKSWTVEPPTVAGIEPWQHSDSGTQKFRGNQFRSAPRSYWTGVTPSRFGNTREPVSGQSILTLEEPIEVPAQGDPELSYWSLFQNEPADSGFVQIALTTGSTPADQLDWNVVDEVKGNCGANASGGLTARRIDLGAYKGKKILVRFVYNRSTGTQVNVFPCGWYIDDITISHGTFKEIGTTRDEEFVVTGRPNGTYAYRVKGIYTDGVRTAASNTEIAKVTQARQLPPEELKTCLNAPGSPILGSVGNDTLVGTAGPDVVCGFGGNDNLKGLAGDDTILAGDGNDRANGGPGNDKLFGEKGRDILLGSKGKDRLNGGPKKDTLKGGKGKDNCGRNKRDKRIKC